MCSTDDLTCLTATTWTATRDFISGIITSWRNITHVLVPDSVTADAPHGRTRCGVRVEIEPDGTPWPQQQLSAGTDELCTACATTVHLEDQGSERTSAPVRA